MASGDSRSPLCSCLTVSLSCSSRSHMGTSPTPISSCLLPDNRKELCLERPQLNPCSQNSDASLALPLPRSPQSSLESRVLGARILTLPDDVGKDTVKSEING